MYLGLWLELRPADDLSRIADRVAAMGYAALQAHFPAGCDAVMARRLRRACAESGLVVAAVSGYANPLRPELAPMGATTEQLAAMVELLPTVGSRRLVSWSGTYAAGIGAGHPDNGGDAAWEALRRHVDALLPLLDAVEGELLLEPFLAHVLDSPARAAAFCRAVGSPALGLVLDAPNLLPPERWGRQAEQIAALVAELTPYVGLVHLKDMRLLDGALDMPGPGQGLLDYPALMGAIADAAIGAPMIVEHVRLEQAAAARRFVLRHSRAG
jgi:sugar phosphate isomerase/epimerase